MHSPTSPTSPTDLQDWVRLYGPRCYDLARSVTQDGDEAKDIVQEMWIVALEKAHLCSANSPIGPWLYRVTLNVARASGRSRRAHERIGLKWASKNYESPDTPMWHANVLRRRLWRVVAGLPGLQQEVILLRIVEGMSTEQAAKTLNRAQGTVKASLHRAIRKLRKEFGDDWDEARKAARPKPYSQEE